MEIGLEALIVGLFALLPGFVSSAVSNVLAPQGSASPAGWAVGSIVSSLFLNAAVLAVFLGLQFAAFDFDKPVASLEDSLAAFPIWTVGVYIGALYLLAALWGALAGLLAEYEPRRLVYLTRLSPVGPESSVFAQVMSETFSTRENLRRRGTGLMQVPWVWIDTEDATVLGRLRNSSNVIDKDKAFEIFLSPAFHLRGGTGLSCDAGGLRLAGVYMRVTEKEVVEIYSAGEFWKPA